MKWNSLVAFLKAARLTADDNTALTGIELYPVWAVGLAVEVGQRYQYGDRLYKVVQAHTTQADWTPDVTPALCTVIDVTHAGTIDDPIPAVAGMEYVYGKYYIEGETIYICKRIGEAEGGTIVLQFLPSALVGQYFEVVE